MLSLKLQCTFCEGKAFVCVNTLAELDLVDCPHCERNGLGILHIQKIGSLDRGYGGKGPPELDKRPRIMAIRKSLSRSSDG